MKGSTHTARGGFGRPYALRIAVTAICASAAVVVAGTAGAASGPYAVKSRLERLPSLHSTRGTGALRGKLKLAGNDSSFTWTLTFRHLSGKTVRAGIYFGKAAKPSQLAMLLCNGCTSGARSYYHGSYVDSPTFVRAIRGGHAYVVIQTKRHPKGEIRGRISAKLA